MTTIRSLFEEWHRTYDAAADDSVSDEHGSKLCHDLTAIEKQIMALPHKTAMDLLIKIICFTQVGGFIISDELMAEACAMVGWPQLPRQEAA